MPIIDREDIVCLHEGRRCSAVAGDCLCDCANCDERRAIAVLDSDIRYELPDDDLDYEAKIARELETDARADREREDELPDDEGDRYPEHDCPKDVFLNDPITEYYGVGSEMVGLIKCPICDEENETPGYDDRDAD